MSTSTILFLTGVACGVLFAGLTVWVLLNDGVNAQDGARNAKGGRKAAKARAAAPPSPLRWALPVVIFLACTGFGALAYLIDSDVADSTLYEAEVPVPGPQATRFDFAVEHPGVEHDLLVAPSSDTDESAAVELRVQVSDPAGQVVLDAPASVEARCDPLCEWRSHSAQFTPAVPGTYTLTVTAAAPEVTGLHVRVGDPEKTDGERIPGY